VASIDLSCPGTIETTPRTLVSIVGTVADEVTAIGWRLVSAPSGSAVGLDSSATLEAAFTPDPAGRYQLRLEGTLDDGSRVYCETSVHVLATESLRVELTWNGPDDNSCEERELPPGCDHTDVDLHLLNAEAVARFDERNDCYWKTCVPPSANDWVARGVRRHQRRRKLSRNSGAAQQSSAHLAYGRRDHPALKHAA
jgi:hypothetical protein